MRNKTRVSVRRSVSVSTVSPLKDFADCADKLVCGNSAGYRWLTRQLGGWYQRIACAASQALPGDQPSQTLAIAWFSYLVPSHPNSLARAATPVFENVSLNAQR